MESSSQAFEGSEECLSSESGWTMYIGSPMEEDDEGAEDEPSTHDNEDAEDGGDKGDKDGGDGAAESDDSMASDASSRPSYRGCAASKNDGLCAAKKGQSKTDYREEDDDDDLKQRDDGTNPSPSKGKVSKSLRIKKRK